MHSTGYGLDDAEVGARVQVGFRILSSPRRPDLFWGSPSPYPMGTVALSLRVKQPGREADHSPQLLPRSRIRGSIYPVMYNRPMCGRSTGTYTNLGDLQRDLRGLSPTPPKKKYISSSLYAFKAYLRTGKTLPDSTHWAMLLSATKCFGQSWTLQYRLRHTRLPFIAVTLGDCS
jgi:hypothetical protein